MPIFLLAFEVLHGKKVVVRVSFMHDDDFDALKSSSAKRPTVNKVQGDMKPTLRKPPTSYLLY
jgi:hypothetical protein